MKKTLTSVIFLTTSKCIFAFHQNHAKLRSTGKVSDPWFVRGIAPRNTKTSAERLLDFPQSLYDKLGRDAEESKEKNLINGSASKVRRQTTAAVKELSPLYSNYTDIASSIGGPGYKYQDSLHADQVLMIGGVLQEVKQAAYRTRLLEERFYASKEAFDSENLRRPPSLRDLNSVNSAKDSWIEKFWITLPARILTFGVACFIFPYIMLMLEHFVTMSPDQLGAITSNLGPGISILYGTFTSLTLSILYQRIKAIQEVVATEASFLVLMLRSTLSLLKGDPTLTLDAGQTVALQIRTLVKSSRGLELIQIMYADPYARLFQIVDNFEESLSDQERNRKSSLIESCRDLVKELIKCRSVRLSEEARALPLTHFLILNVLTALLLLSYCANVLPTLDQIGSPPEESVWIFGILATIYILFDYFARDLNNPYQGVYQIRRSTAATHLLEAKWIMVNHPVLRDSINFDDPSEEYEEIGEASFLRYINSISRPEEH